jgi:hypothetical protein
MQKTSKSITKKINFWEEAFATAKPMRLNAFNTGRITGKVKTYADSSSFPENVDCNTDLDCDMMAFSFMHPEKGDVLIDCGFSKSFTDNPPYGNLSFVMKILKIT